MKTYDEFLDELKAKGKALGIDTGSLVEKYEKRIVLAKEAGFTESEAVAKFGSVDVILAEAAGTEKKDQHIVANVVNPKMMKLFSLNIAHGCDVHIESADGEGISWEMDPEIMGLYTVTANEKEFIIKPTFSNKNKYHVRGDIFIRVGKNLVYERLMINSVSADINSCAFQANDVSISSVSGDMTLDGLSGERISINTVSGDFRMNSVVAGKLELSMVSGDIEISGKAETVTVSTVSGDANLTGNFENIKASSISGEVTVNSERKNKTLGETIRSHFKV